MKCMVGARTLWPIYRWERIFLGASVKRIGDKVCFRVFLICFINKRVRVLKQETKVLVSTNTKHTKHKSVHSCVCTKHKHGFVFCGFCDKTEHDNLCVLCFEQLCFVWKWSKIDVLLGFFDLCFVFDTNTKPGFDANFEFWLLIFQENRLLVVNTAIYSFVQLRNRVDRPNNKLRRSKSLRENKDKKIFFSKKYPNKKDFFKSQSFPLTI